MHSVKQTFSLRIFPYQVLQVLPDVFLLLMVKWKGQLKEELFKRKETKLAGFNNKTEHN